MRPRYRLGISALEERLGVSRRTISRWTRSGHLPPPHYLGTHRLWFSDEIEAWERQRMSGYPATRYVEEAEAPGGDVAVKKVGGEREGA